MLCINKLEIIF